MKECRKDCVFIVALDLKIKHLQATRELLFAKTEIAVDSEANVKAVLEENRSVVGGEMTEVLGQFVTAVSDSGVDFRAQRIKILGDAITLYEGLEKRVVESCRQGSALFSGKGDPAIVRCDGLAAEAVKGYLQSVSNDLNIDTS